MPKISIIVPVYNTAKYIKRCLDSITNQTIIDDLEIIVINDGSKDNSEEVIKKYIDEHKKTPKPTIKYYSKQNTGIAKTRNFGIQKASGKYILFVDSDDYIDIHLVETLKSYMEKNVDLIKFKLQRIDESGKILEKVDGPEFYEISGEKAFEKMYSTDVLLDSPCVYAIKKELFTKNEFEFQRTYHEDFGLIPLIILKAKTVVSLPNYLYYYVQAPNSITRNENYGKTIQKMEDALAHYDNMIIQTQKMSLQKRTLENIKIYYTNAIILKIEELKPEDQKHYIKEIKKRRMYNNIKPRNLKQLIKKIILKVNVKLYLKMR